MSEKKGDLVVAYTTTEHLLVDLDKSSNFQSPFRAVDLLGTIDDFDGNSSER